LAVYDAAGRHALGRRDHLGHLRGQVGQAAVLQADRPVRIAEQDATKTVPLDLEEVLGRAERRLGRRGLHGAHLAREALQLDLELAFVNSASRAPPAWLLQPGDQLRRPVPTRLFGVSWSRRRAFPWRRAASWPARPTAAGPPSGP